MFVTIVVAVAMVKFQERTWQVNAAIFMSRFMPAQAGARWSANRSEREAKVNAGFAGVLYGKTDISQAYKLEKFLT